ncbi:MAG: hypothetical protein ACRESS_00050 [Stenotrophobium sp.]
MNPSSTTPLNLNLHGSLRATRRVFRKLSLPISVAGAWRAEFAGPQWLRRLAPLGFKLAVLRGWYGKTFDDDGGGLNLVRRNGRLRRITPMQLTIRPSRLDGGLVIAAQYNEDAPLRLLRVVDEFRSLDNDTLLGMMTLDLPALRSLCLPFLLHRIEPRKNGRHRKPVDAKAVHHYDLRPSED